MVKLQETSIEFDLPIEKTFHSKPVWLLGNVVNICVLERPFSPDITWIKLDLPESPVDFSYEISCLTNGSIRNQGKTLSCGDQVAARNL